MFDGLRWREKTSHKHSGRYTDQLYEEEKWGYMEALQDIDKLSTAIGDIMYLYCDTCAGSDIVEEKAISTEIFQEVKTVRLLGYVKFVVS